MPPRTRSTRPSLKTTTPKGRGKSNQSDRPSATETSREGSEGGTSEEEEQSERLTWGGSFRFYDGEIRRGVTYETMNSPTPHQRSPNARRRCEYLSKFPAAHLFTEKHHRPKPPPRRSRLAATPIRVRPPPGRSPTRMQHHRRWWRA